MSLSVMFVPVTALELIIVHVTVTIMTISCCPVLVHYGH